MTVSISRTDAEIISALALDDLRGYAARYPEDHKAYLAIKQPAKGNRKSRPARARKQPKGVYIFNKEEKNHE